VEGPGGFLNLLDDDARADLEALGRRRRYRPGAALFRQGERGASVVVLLEGRTKVVVDPGDGQEVLLSVRGPGEMLGELAALDGAATERLATVRAVDEVTALVVPAPKLQVFAQRHPGTAMAVVRTLAGRIRAADRRRSEVASLDVATRLARLLLDLHAEHGEGLALSQAELGSLIGASRESAARALGTLREAGLVTSARKRVTIVDRTALEAFAS
jgi:CRP/FNR family cyclic AMP-dependent transcriptional regulator